MGRGRGGWVGKGKGARSTVDAERELMSEIRGNPFSLAIVEEDPPRSRPAQLRSRYCRRCRSAAGGPPTFSASDPSAPFSPARYIRRNYAERFE